MPSASPLIPSSAAPSLSEYAARGLRIALVGGPDVGKTHVFRKLDSMRTYTNNLRLYEHRSIPRNAFREKLNELKRLIANTHDMPDPCDHLYVIWYFASNRWEPADDTFVAELSRLCEVIVVVAKGDQRSTQVDPSTGRTEADEIEAAVRENFPNISIVHCSDPSLAKCETGQRDGSPVSCGETHTGAYPARGFDELLEESLNLLPDLHIRALRRVAQVKEQKEWRMWMQIAVGVLAFAAVVKLGKSLLYSSSRSKHINSAGRKLVSLTDFPTQSL